MGTTTEFKEEQLNYYRICFITVDVISEGLRTIFKQQWDNRYKATLGEWKDEPRNGLDFKNQESPRNQARNARLLATMVNGNRAEWDCTMLFYAILYSDSIGGGLTAAVQSNVDDLRKFRNEVFAHLPRSYLSKPDFLAAIATVDGAFQGLGLSTQPIQEIRNQTCFPTGELTKVLKRIEEVKDELIETEKQRKILEDQLHSEISTFCILPPKPSHEVARRIHEVVEIVQQLKQQKEANESRLTRLYISGNPGSGKSQLAGLIAEKWYEENLQISGMNPFVMTLNAQDLCSLLESYTSFARLLKCPEYAVTSTLNNKDLNTGENRKYEVVSWCQSGALSIVVAVS